VASLTKGVCVRVTRNLTSYSAQKYGPQELHSRKIPSLSELKAQKAQTAALLESRRLKYSNSTPLFLPSSIIPLQLHFKDLTSHFQVLHNQLLIYSSPGYASSYKILVFEPLGKDPLFDLRLLSS